MKAYVVRAPGGFDRPEIVERPDPGAPVAGEIRVAIHATSLNFHDLRVADGSIPAADGRILMADGGGCPSLPLGCSDRIKLEGKVTSRASARLMNQSILGHSA